jgi:hypothetical protein
MNTDSQRDELADDPWGSPGGSGPVDGPGAEPLSGVAAEDPPDQPLDVEAQEVRRRPLGPKIAIAVVAVLAVGSVGFGMHNLWRKLNPQSEVAQAQPEDRTEVLVSAGNAPVASAVPAATDQALMPGAVSTGSPVSTVIAGAAPAAVDVAKPVEPSVVVPAAPAAPISRPAGSAVPSLPSQVAAAPQVPPSPPMPADPAAIAEPTPSAAEIKRARLALEQKKPTARQGSAGQVDHAAEQTARAARRFTSTARPSGAAPRASRVAKSAPKEVPVETMRDLGLLGEYRIESIEPKYGEFQNAWIRSRSGQLRVVTSGDSVDGARILKVDGSSYTVQTTQGVIR